MTLKRLADDYCSRTSLYSSMKRMTTTDEFRLLCEWHERQPDKVLSEILGRLRYGNSQPAWIMLAHELYPDIPPVREESRGKIYEMADHIIACFHQWRVEPSRWDLDPHEYDPYDPDEDYDPDDWENT